MSSSEMVNEYISGCSGFRNTPALEESADLDPVWPVIAWVLLTCRAVATDCNNVLLLILGPMGLNPRGSSIGPNSVPSVSHAPMFCKVRAKKNVKNLLLNHQVDERTSNRFSQNSCLGFSCVDPCFTSLFTFDSWFRCTVTGCLKIDAVWRIGGTKDTSARPPRLFQSNTKSKLN